MSLFHSTLASVLEVLENQKADYLMVGGLAVNYYGYTRLTTDIDLMVALPNVDTMVVAMKNAGFTSFSVSPLVIFFKKPEPAVRVDFLRVDQVTLAKLLRSAFPATVQGCQVNMPSLNDLLAMKFFSLAQSPLRRGKDLMDIVWLSLENKLDAETVLRPLAMNFASEEIYQQVCAMLPSAHRKNGHDSK